MALGGNEIPGASVFFFSFDQKAKESTFVSVFVFVCLLFFSFFFQKRSGMLREDFFLK